MALLLLHAVNLRKSFAQSIASLLPAPQLCLILLALCSLFLSACSFDEDTFPGWMGEDQKSFEVSVKPAARNPDRIDPRRIKRVSWKPRAFLYEGFLTHEECDHLIELARPYVERSMVADSETGESKLSEVRTSAGTFLGKGADEVVSRIENRIAAWTYLPPENGESIQVLRYEHGEKYEPHWDYFSDPKNLRLGGHRVATVLMYLSDVELGGETVFTFVKDDRSKDDGTWSDCGKIGVAVKPQKGNALLFFSLHPDASTDEYSMHTGCPVLKGEKWSATKWIHVSSFDAAFPDVESCTDLHPLCEEWAVAGECDKNPGYMVGTKGGIPGNCRKSCGMCEEEDSPQISLKVGE